MQCEAMWQCQKREKDMIQKLKKGVNQTLGTYIAMYTVDQFCQSHASLIDWTVMSTM